MALDPDGPYWTRPQTRWQRWCAHFWCALFGHGKTLLGRCLNCREDVTGGFAK